MNHHPNSIRFAEDWRARRSGRRPPHRRDLDPALFGALAPQLFMLGLEADGAEVFRVAGALLADLHGRELSGQAFERLWTRTDRAAAAAEVRRARRLASPLVLRAEGVTADDQRTTLELTLAPVLGHTGEVDRTYGLYQPLTLLARLKGGVLGGLRLLSSAPALEPVRLVTVEGRRVA